MPQLVDENTFDLYKNGMRDLRDTLGRNFVINLPGTSVDCPNCLFDSVNKSSAGVFQPDSPYPINIPGPKNFKGRCPICRGKGIFETEVQFRRIKGIVTWLKGKDREVEIFGVKQFVDVRISNMDIRSYDLFVKALFYTVDDLKLFLRSKPIKEGLRDLIKFTAFLSFNQEAGAQGAR